MTANVRKALVVREIEEKQKRIRLKWFEKHFNLLQAQAAEGEDVEISPLMVELINEVSKMRKARFQKDRESLASKRLEKEALRQGKVPFEEIEISPEILKRGPMYPVEKEIFEELFKGFSKDREGRWLYLKLRNKKAPCERYYDIQATQQEYGWKIQERALPANKQFARKSVIKPQFYRRTGVKGETLRNRPPFSGNVEIDILS